MQTIIIVNLMFRLDAVAILAIASFKLPCSRIGKSVMKTNDM